MKRKLYLVLDVETANTTEDALVYDLGFVVCDKKGTIYEQKSLIVSDIFYGESDLMNSAYYAEKIPQYAEGIKTRTFQVVSFYTAKKIIAETIRKYNISAVCAYNANFDTKALNTTERWLTKSKYRFFLPYGIEIFCIWSMACQTLCMQKAFIRFCFENGFVSPSGNVKTSAETVYAYITQNPTFDESHTGLADVLIETKIMAKCFRQHKKMDKQINRLCWRIPQALAKEIRAELAEGG